MASSKFFAGVDEPESDGENDNKSEQSVEAKEEVVKKTFFYESSSDEEQKRVVRSEKDKRWEALGNVIDKIKDKMKIDDFVSMADEFDELNKQLEKSKKVVEKEGVPLFYVRICYVLENFLNNLSTDKKNSLKPANKKAYNTLKHKVKKNNKLYEEKIKAFQANPTYSDEEDDEDDGRTKKDAKKSKAQKKEDSDDEWKSGGSEAEEEEEESDEDEEDIRKYLQSTDPMVRRNYWLKRETKDETKKKREKTTKPRPVIQKGEEETEEPEKEKKKIVYTLDELDKKIVEIVERRAGRKVSVKEKKITVEDDLEALQYFLDKIKGEEIKRLEVLLILMPTRLDFSRQFSQYCMPRNLWLDNFENLQDFFKIIKNKKNNLSQVRTFQKDGDLYYKESSIVESFSTHFDGLDNELYKAFKGTESSSPEYAERLRDNAQMIKLSDEAYHHFKNTEDNIHTIKFAQKKLEYTYYMPDKLFEKLRNSAAERAISIKHEFYEDVSSEKSVHELATKVYTSNDNKVIIKTLLYHVYNHAINGRYHIAKEYFLMSHIPEITSNLDVHTQILYNRTLVQLGLAAFSLGLIQECVNSLGDIVSPKDMREVSKIREHLGQAISRNPMNEKEERRRVLPFHMHINTEVVEAVHLVSTMLLEIPNIILDPFDSAKKQLSKSRTYFRKLFENYRSFHGPPETYRDRIMVASKELYQGNWHKCYEHLSSASNVWGKLTQNTKTTLENLLIKVKEQAFKCNLFTLQNCYDSIEIHTLAKQFELENDAVFSLISKMVFNGEIKAYLDVASKCLIFERGDINKLESRALTLADRVATLLDNNEKIMDSKYGNYGITDKDLDGLSKKRPTNKKKMNTILNKDKRKKVPRKN